MSLSFYLFFCTYHFFFFVLISSLRPIFCPSSTSSTSFHSNFSFFLSRSQSDHLPSQASFSSFSSIGQITYPPQAPISTTRTTRIKPHKNHKNQNPQAQNLSTHKHRSSPLASIHKHQNPFPLTHKH